jgi:hypothetical protein
MNEGTLEGIKRWVIGRRPPRSPSAGALAESRPDGAAGLVDVSSKRVVPAERVRLGVEDAEIERKGLASFTDLHGDDIDDGIDVSIPRCAAPRESERSQDVINASDNRLAVDTQGQCP